MLSAFLMPRGGIRSCAQWMMSQRLYNVFNNHGPPYHPSPECAPMLLLEGDTQPFDRHFCVCSIACHRFDAPKR